MHRFIKIEVSEKPNDRAETRIEMSGDLATIMTFLTEALLAINKQVDGATGKKNLFWNGMVDAVGKALLEESIK